MEMTSTAVFSSLLALSAVQSVWAQAPDQGAVRPQPQAPSLKAQADLNQQVARLTRDLELTPEQQAMVMALSKARNERIKAIIQSAPSGERKYMVMAQAHAVETRYHRQVNGLLTPRQLDLAKAMLAELTAIAAS